MKKLFVVLALLTLSTLSFAATPVPNDTGGLYIVDGKKVYFCNYAACKLISSDYTK
jgi:hypothetical protein